MNELHPSAGRSAGPFVTIVILLAAGMMLVFGAWGLVNPESFAEFVKFPEHTHFIHDAGAFQVGVGVVLLLALIWRDPLAIVLAGFLVTNSLHAVNHAVDLDSGGRDSDPWLLSALSILTAVALVARLRQLHYVVGYVANSGSPALAPFVEQKTAVVTSFRRDHTPVATPVSVAVDGERAVFRSFERAGKTKRIRNDPHVEVAPSTARGQPLGPAIGATARRLDGAEARDAARLLRRKHPFLHGIVVPISHRLGRSRTGRTVHFELIPDSEANA